MAFICSACLGPVPTPPPVTPSLPEPEGIDVYFTEPTLWAKTGGPAAELVEAINHAHASVDVAAYTLSLPAILEALQDAYLRGVWVRIVMESDNLDQATLSALKGIDIVGDQADGLMHDKFVIIDGKDVWTGSMNYSLGSAYRDNNNLLHIRSRQVAQDYVTEFDEMFVDGRFGPASPADTPYPRLQVAGKTVEVYFSPDDGVQDQLEALLESARTSIYVLAYTFTADPLADVLIEKAGQGVLIGIVVDADQVEASGSDVERFRSAGLDVRLDGNYGLMHHKVIIVDGDTVVCGSYNFTASAEKRNDENLLILHDPDLARQFLAEYRRVAEHASPITP